MLVWLSPALADVKIANVREYEMRRHIERGTAMRTDSDDTYPQLGAALENVAAKGMVTWGDLARMEKASLVKVKISLPDRETLRALGVEEVPGLKGVSEPGDGTAWSAVTFQEGNGAGQSPMVIQVDNDGSAYQIISHVAVKVDAEFRRFALREEGSPAYSLTQNYFSYLAEAGKLKDWIASTLKPTDGISVLVIRRENRRRAQELFDVQTLAQPDRAYVFLAGPPEGGAQGRNYEIVLGWEERKLSKGSSGLSTTLSGDRSF